MKRRARILLLCGVGHLYSHFYMLAYPSLVLWIHQDFSVDRSQALSWGTPMYILFGAASIPFGALGDRFSNRKLLAAMLIGMGLFSFLAALATTPTFLQIALIGIGLCAAIYHPVGMSLISRCCERRGQAMGNNGVWGSLGIGLPPFLVGSISAALGWRGAFWICGVPALVTGIIYLVQELDEAPLPEHTESSLKDEKRSIHPALLFSILMLSCTLIGWSYRGTVVSLPLAFRSYSESFAAMLKPEALPLETVITWMVSAVYLVSVLGQVLGGKLADRMDLRKGYLLFHACSLPCMLIMSRAGGALLFFAAMSFVFFSVGMQPIENSLVARLTPLRYRSFAYSLKFTLVFGTGALAVQLARYFDQQGNLQRLYQLQSGLVCCVLLCIACIFLVTRGLSYRNQS